LNPTGSRAKAIVEGVWYMGVYLTWLGLSWGVGEGNWGREESGAMVGSRDRRGCHERLAGVDAPVERRTRDP
jgi:hypothetical protein